jgi:hypothetical protein
MFGENSRNIRVEANQSQCPMRAKRDDEYGPVAIELTGARIGRRSRVIAGGHMARMGRMHWEREKCWRFNQNVLD